MKTQNMMTLLGGALVGAAAMYLMDPEMGQRRRKYVAKQAGDYLGESRGHYLRDGTRQHATGRDSNLQRLSAAGHARLLSGSGRRAQRWQRSVALSYFYSYGHYGFQRRYC